MATYFHGLFYKSVDNQKAMKKCGFPPSDYGGVTGFVNEYGVKVEIIPARKCIAAPKHHKRPAWTHGKLQKLMEMHGGKCFWCGKVCDNSSKRLTPTRDHLIRVADGGSSAMENLVLACAHCNSTRHVCGWTPSTEKGIKWLNKFGMESW